MSTLPEVVVVPAAPALLPEYAGLDDPVAEVRAAALDAVDGLVQRHPTRVVVLTGAGDPGNTMRGVPEAAGSRVARTLLGAVGFTGETVVAIQPGPVPDVAGAGVLVVADGSARRGEKAPGHLDERAEPFDAAIEAALAAADAAALRDLDPALGVALLAAGVPAFRALGAVAPTDWVSDLSYAGDPFGVRYWVVR